MTETLKLHYPTKPYQIGQKFGECYPSVCAYYKQMGLSGHNGIDSVAADGTIVRAAHDGVVTFAGEDGSGGLGVVVRTNEQFQYKDGAAFFKTIYWHMKVGEIWARPSQVVRTGEPLGLSDNTGLSTGPHLHFGIKPLNQGESDWQWWNAESENGYKGAVDPMPYFTGAAAVDSYSYSFAGSMGFGVEGPEVRALQIALQAEGDFPQHQEPTGFFGRVTEEAVKKFQRRHDIVTWGTPFTTGYGRFGPRTRQALNGIFSKTP